MSQEDDSVFIVLDEDTAEALCDDRACIRHGVGTIECPLRIAEAKILDGVADDLPSYL